MPRELAEADGSVARRPPRRILRRVVLVERRERQALLAEVIEALDERVTQGERELAILRRHLAEKQLELAEITRGDR
jgi:hypothetical protein